MRHSRHSAFTIMELLVVIGIIAILMALLLPVAERVPHRSYINACAANLHTIGQAMVMYANENRGNFPVAQIFVSATAASATPSVVFNFDVENPVTGTYGEVLDSAAVTGI